MADKFFSEDVTTRDPELASAIADELKRQQHEIELIASENIVSHAVTVSYTHLTLPTILLV